MTARSENLTARQQEILGIEVDGPVPRLPQRQHLARIVPLVKRRRRVDPLVALQPDDGPTQHAAKRSMEALLFARGVPAGPEALDQRFQAAREAVAACGQSNDLKAMRMFSNDFKRAHTD